MRVLPAILVISALALTGCTASTPSDGKLSVVASTDVWGDIVTQIAGTHVDVTSIITNPSQDPHSYQADAQVQLALSKADVVVENGGGYDDFVDTMLSAANNSKVAVLNAVKLSGVGTDPTLNDVNEHVWYDFPGVQKVAAKIASTLESKDPSNAAAFRANFTTFDATLADFEASEASLKSQYAGTGVAITEPVPLYMLEACGLVDQTSPAFSKAIEDGTDVAPLVLKNTLALFTDHTVKVLAYNEQTTGPETDQVLAAAKANHIAIVAARETLPANTGYVQWMTDNLSQLKAALAG